MRVVVLLVSVFAIPGCTLVTPRQGDGTVTLGTKCAGSITLMLSTAGLAAPLVEGMAGATRGAGPCSTLLGLGSDPAPAARPPQVGRRK